MLSGGMRVIVIVGLAIHFLWPRYFFVNLFGVGLNPFTVSAAILLFLSVYLMILNRSIRQHVASSARQSPIALIAFFLYWFWRILADSIGISPSNSLMITFTEFLYLGSWLLTGIVVFADPITRGRFVGVLFIVALLALLVGYVEMQAKQPIITLLSLDRFMAGDSTTIDAMSKIQMRGDSIRVRSLFSHPIVYGQIVASMIPVALHFIFRGRPGFIFMGLTMLLAIFLSIDIAQTRSPILVGAVSVSLYLAITIISQRRITGLVFCFFAIFPAIIFSSSIMTQADALAGGRDAGEAGSSVARQTQWDMGTAALKSSPIAGYGAGQSLHYAGIISGNSKIATIDSYFLSTSVDSGYVGCSIMLIMFMSFVFRGIRTSFNSGNSYDVDLRGAFAGMVAGLACGLAVVSISDTMSVIFLVSGYLISSSSKYTQPS